MKDPLIACCCHPATVVLVDDSRKFHTTIKLLLDRKSSVYQFYDDSSKALQFLKNEYKANPFTKRCLLRVEEQHKDHRNLEVDASVIHEEVYNPSRFDEISVIIVDYVMPSLSGAEFAEQMKGYPFKIILLTGEADERIATDLFNKGLIHKFIRKDTSDFGEVLKSAICELQQKYFTDQSELVINSLTKNPDYPPSCLDEQVFINFFNKFCAEHRFTEYYLLEATGSFLFLDADGRPSMLLVKDNDEMEGAVSDAELSDTDAPADILKDLKDRKMLLHRYTNEDYFKQPNEWRSLMYPAQKLEGRATYYYAYIDDPKKCPVDLSKVLSYKEYLSKL